MSIVQKFRLTKLLHDQVEGSGDKVENVLRSWSEKDYKRLCDYVTQCRGVVPKYVARLARLTGASTGSVVTEIIGAQEQFESLADDSSQGSAEGIGYLPEDMVERSAYLQSIVGDRESSYSM